MHIASSYKQGGREKQRVLPGESLPEQSVNGYFSGEKSRLCIPGHFEIIR